MRRKRGMFSLIKKSIKSDMLENDIFINGYLSSNLLILIENLKNNSKGDIVEFSIQDLNNSYGIVINSDQFQCLIKDICDVSVTINIPKKFGIFSICDQIKFDEQQCKMKLNKSFMFLMQTEILSNLNNAEVDIK